MQRNVLAALAAVIVLGGGIWLWRSGSEPAHDGALSDDASQSDGVSHNGAVADRAASAGMQRGSGGSSLAHGAAAKKGNAAPAGTGERTGTHPNTAGADLRDRLAQARRVGSGSNVAVAPGENIENEGNFAVDMPPDTQAQKEGVHPGKTPAQGGDTTTTHTDTTVDAVVPNQDPNAIPEIAYQSEPDKRFSTETQEQIPETKINTEAGSLSFWVKPDWQPGDETDATFMQLGDSGLQVKKNVSFLRFEYLDSSGVERGVGFSMNEWKTGEWQQVTANLVNGRQLELWVNGKMVSQKVFDQPPDFQNPNLYVGSDVAEGVASPAELAGVKHYNRPLSGPEINDMMQSPDRPNAH